MYVDLNGFRILLHPEPDSTVALEVHCLRRDEALGHVRVTPSQLAELARALHHRTPHATHGVCGGTITVYGWPGMCLHPVHAPGGIAVSTAGFEHALWKVLTRAAERELVAS